MGFICFHLENQCFATFDQAENWNISISAFKKNASQSNQFPQGHFEWFYVASFEWFYAQKSSPPLNMQLILAFTLRQLKIAINNSHQLIYKCNSHWKQHEFVIAILYINNNYSRVVVYMQPFGDSWPEFYTKPTTHMEAKSWWGSVDVSYLVVSTHLKKICSSKWESSSPNFGMKIKKSLKPPPRYGWFPKTLVLVGGWLNQPIWKTNPVSLFPRKQCIFQVSSTAMSSPVAKAKDAQPAVSSPQLTVPDQS